MAKIKMYTKQVCPYCVKAKAYLKAMGINNIEEISIEGSEALKSEMVKLSGRQTVPQIFIGDFHVGGCDDLLAFDKTKILDLING